MYYTEDVALEIDLLHETNMLERIGLSYQEMSSLQYILIDTAMARYVSKEMTIVNNPDDMHITMFDFFIVDRFKRTHNYKGRDFVIKIAHRPKYITTTTTSDVRHPHYSDGSSCMEGMLGLVKNLLVSGKVVFAIWEMVNAITQYNHKDPYNVIEHREWCSVCRAQVFPDLVIVSDNKLFCSTCVRKCNQCQQIYIRSTGCSCKVDSEIIPSLKEVTDVAFDYISSS